jgi:hypothetical protein
VLQGFDHTQRIGTKSTHAIAEAAKTWGQEDGITVLTLAFIATSSRANRGHSTFKRCRKIDRSGWEEPAL